MIKKSILIMFYCWIAGVGEIHQFITLHPVPENRKTELYRRIDKWCKDTNDTGGIFYIPEGVYDDAFSLSETGSAFIVGEPPLTITAEDGRTWKIVPVPRNRI